MTYTYVQNFKDTIGFRPLLEQHLQQYDGLKAPNSTYSIADAVNFMVDAVFQGYSRFSHMEELRKDQAYLSICGGAAPSEKVCRDTLALPPPDAAAVMRGINKDLLATQAKTEGVREVAADFDDSVIPVFGNQERSNVGFADLDTSDVDFHKTIKEDYEEVFDEEEMSTMVRYLESHLDAKNIGILLMFVTGVHKIRKTYGTILLDDNIDNRLIMGQMGHTDITCTETHYHRNRKSIEKKSNILSSIPDFKAQ